MDKQNQTELALKACKLFSAGVIVSLLLEIYFVTSQQIVLFVFLTPLTFGSLMGLVTCPWLNSLKPLLFKIIAGAMFVVGALLGVAFIMVTGGGMQ